VAAVLEYFRRPIRQRGLSEDEATQRQARSVSPTLAEVFEAFPFLNESRSSAIIKAIEKAADSTRDPVFLPWTVKSRANINAYSYRQMSLHRSRPVCLLLACLIEALFPADCWRLPRLGVKKIGDDRSKLPAIRRGVYRRDFVRSRTDKSPSWKRRCFPSTLWKRQRQPSDHRYRVRVSAPP